MTNKNQDFTDNYLDNYRLFDGTKSMFCIGFSMNDAYVKRMLMEDIGRFQGKHYVMLAFDGKEARRNCREKIREFEKENLVVVPYYPHYPDASVSYAQAIRNALVDLLDIPGMTMYQRAGQWIQTAQKYYGNYVLEKLYKELFHELRESGTNNVYETVTIGNETETSLLTYLRSMWKERRRKPVLLVGKGGSGKTISILNTCQKLLEEKICALYIPLCDFKSGTLEEYIKNRIFHAPITGQTDAWWKNLQEKCVMSASYTPQVVLFLDGVNELMLDNNCRMQFRSDISNWLYPQMPGVQIVLSSRDMLEEYGIYFEYSCLEVQPLKDEQIEYHFKSLGQPLPEKDGKLWELIRNPLMMSLFLYTKLFEKTFRGREQIFGEWSVSDAPSAFQIIHNFLLSQLYKNIRNYPDSMDAAAWYYAAEYGAAKIGWELYQEQKFQAEELQISQWLENLEGEKWIRNRRLERLLLRCGRERSWTPGSYEQIRILHHALSILCVNGLKENGEDGVYWGFMHQTMRDYFAARALWNDWTSGCIEGKKRWQAHRLNKDVLELLGDMVKGTQWMEIWNQLAEKRKIRWEKNHRYTEEKEGFLELNLLRLTQYIYDLPYEEVLLAWHDLRNIPLYDCTGISERKAMDFTGALVSRRTFFTLGHTSYIYEAAFSPDGKYLLTASADQTMILWDSILLHPLFTYVEKDFDVDGIAWNPDSTRFLSWGNDKRIVCWNLMESEASCIYEATGMLSGECVQWCNSEECIVYDNGQILRVSIEKKCRRVASVESAVRVSFSQKGKYLAVINRAAVKVYDVNQTDIPLVEKACNGSEKSKLVFAPNEKDFVFFDTDGGWVYRKRRWYRLHEKRIRNVVWSSDGQYFYTIGKYLKRYKLENLKCVRLYDRLQNFETAAVSPSRESIFVGRGVMASMFDEETGHLLCSYCGEDRRIRELNVEGCSEVFTTTRKKTKHWRKNNQNFTVIAEEDGEKIIKTDGLIPTDKLVIETADGTKYLCYDGTWKIIEKGDCNVITFLKDRNQDEFCEGLYTIQWSADGSAIIGLDWRFHYYVWETENGFIVKEGVLDKDEIGLVESVILGKDNVNIFFNTQEGNLWIIRQGIAKKVKNSCAFGNLKYLDSSIFLAKNCNYTTWRTFSSDTGEMIEELVSIEGMEVLRAEFANVDFGEDEDLKEWIISNGGCFSA